MSTINEELLDDLDREAIDDMKVTAVRLAQVSQEFELTLEETTALSIAAMGEAMFSMMGEDTEETWKLVIADAYGVKLALALGSLYELDQEGE